MKALAQPVTGRRLAYAFFVVALLYPTLKVLLTGSRTAATLPEMLFAAVPDLLLLAVVGVAALAVVNRNGPRWKVLDGAVALFFSFNVLYGLAIGQDLKLGAYSMRLTYLPVLLYFAARVLYGVESKRFFEFFGWLALVTAAVGLVLYVFFHDAVEWMMKAGNYFESVYFIPRLTSILWNTIMYAALAGYGTLYFFWRYLKSGRLIWWIPLYVVLASLVLTISRGAIWGTLIASFFVVAATGQWKRSLLVYVKVAVLIMLAWNYTASREVIAWGVESTGSTIIEGETRLTRVELWRRSFNDFKEQPWGYGLGKAGHVAYRFLLNDPANAAVWSTDGWYMKMANETGVLGLVTVLLLGLAALVFMWQRRRALRHDDNPWLLGVAVLTAVQCVVSNVLDFYFVAPLFWFLFGLFVNGLTAHAKR